MQIYGNVRKRLHKKRVQHPTGLVCNTNMAAVLLFWNTNMAAVLLFWNTDMAVVMEIFSQQCVLLLVTSSSHDI